MIGRARHQADRAINLLGGQNADQFVRPGEGAKTDFIVIGFFDIAREPVRAANQKYQIRTAIVFQLFQMGGEVSRGPVLAALIEQEDFSPSGYLSQKLFALLILSVPGLNFNLRHITHAKRRAELFCAGDIIVHKLALRAAFHAAHCDEADFH